MSEPRKNHLTIDGGQVKEDEHVASYKPIPDSDAGEFRSSKASLHKSKEKVDEAEEKLLEKEDEAKITTRVDMADAKYVVGDHRNGDAKIELDANKRQFSGLTKEELMQYADDPFWVRLRWAMFILFWALWLCMLAGAIAIIVQAPKCAPPTPKTWFEKGPLVEAGPLNLDSESVLPVLRETQAAGMFAAVTCGSDAYHVLQAPRCVERFKQAVATAKENGVKLIVDLVANFVPDTHEWFQLSENRSAEFDDYFIWAKGNGFDAATNKPNPPNNWVSVTNGAAWSYSEERKQFYLHQYGEGKADLNFSNPTVVRQFDKVLKTYMQAGAGGVRLQYGRQLLVNGSLADESPSTEKSALGAAHSDYLFWRHRHGADQPALGALLAHWATVVDDHADPPAAGESVFTLAESGDVPELFLLGGGGALRPPSAAPLGAAPAAAARLDQRLNSWPAIQLTAPSGGAELAAFALLLPAAPVLTLDQLQEDANTTASESLWRLVELRADAAVQHGARGLRAVPARNTSDELLAVSRWKIGHTGYVAVWNPHEVPLRADLSSLPAVPEGLTVHRVSPAVRQLTNYTSNQSVKSADVMVPATSTVVLSFVPKSAADE